MVLRDFQEPAHLRRPGDLAGGEVGLPAADVREAAHLVGQFLRAPQVLLEVLPVRGVGVRADHPERPAAGRAADHLASRQNPPPLAGLVPHPELVLEQRSLPGEVFPHRGPAGQQVLGMRQVRPALFVQRNFPGLVAEHPGPPLVMVLQPGLQVPVPHAVIAALQRELPPLLRQPQRLEHGFLRGDVAVQPDEAEGPAQRVTLEVSAGLDVADRAVGLHDAKRRVVGQPLAGHKFVQLAFGHDRIRGVQAIDPVLARAVEIIRVQAVDLQHPVVPHELVVREVDHPDAVVRRAERELQALVQHQRLLRDLVLRGDVALRADDPPQAALGVPLCDPPRLHMAHRMVGPHDPKGQGKVVGPRQHAFKRGPGPAAVLGMDPLDPLLGRARGGRFRQPVDLEEALVGKRALDRGVPFPDPERRRPRGQLEALVEGLVMQVGLP